MPFNRRMRPLCAVLVVVFAATATAEGQDRPPTSAPASGVFTRQPPARFAVLNGVDVLVKENFARLKGRRIGLVTNHTGLDLTGRATIDLLHAAPGVTLVALFSPE